MGSACCTAQPDGNPNTATHDGYTDHPDDFLGSEHAPTVNYTMDDEVASLVLYERLEGMEGFAFGQRCPSDGDMKPEPSGAASSVTMLVQSAKAKLACRKHETDHAELERLAMPPSRRVVGMIRMWDIDVEKHLGPISRRSELGPLDAVSTESCYRPTSLIDSSRNASSASVKARSSPSIDCGSFAANIQSPRSPTTAAHDGGDSDRCGTAGREHGGQGVTSSHSQQMDSSVEFSRSMEKQSHQRSAGGSDLVTPTGPGARYLPGSLEDC